MQPQFRSRGRWDSGRPSALRGRDIHDCVESGRKPDGAQRQWGADVGQVSEGCGQWAYGRRVGGGCFGDRPFLAVPAGLGSRTVDGRVTGAEWKISFLKKAYASQRLIVPVFVEGRLSNFFHRVYHLRKALGIRFNIEMLWLPDEMFSQKGKHFRIVVGDPIPVAELQASGSLPEPAEYVRKKAYFLEKKPSDKAKTPQTHPSFVHRNTQTPLLKPIHPPVHRELLRA